METTQPIPVIVLNWNGIEDTEQCIEQLIHQSYRQLEIFLVDNGSDPENVARLHQIKEKHPEIELMLFDKNFGFTKAHNIVLEQLLSTHADSPYILLLNNDAFAELQWATELIQTAKSTGADMVASKMINYYNSDELDNVGHRFLNTAEIIPEGRGEEPDSFQDPIDNVGACAGAALYSTTMLNAIGVFDTYFETGYEDAELGVRASILGYKSVLAPNAIVHHKISKSVAKIRDFNYVLKTQLNIFYTYFKLMPAGVIALNLPFLIIKYGIVLLLNLIFGRWFFFRVLWKSIYLSLTSERKRIKFARKAFFNKYTPISTMGILKKMEFFLWFDIQRFYKHMIRGEKTQFEKVNQSSSRE